MRHVLHGVTEEKVEPIVCVPALAGIEPDLLINEMIQSIESNSSLEHKILKDLSGFMKWLEITPSNCYIDKELRPVKT